MEAKAVRTSYRRWAPVYDRTFGAVTRIGRAKAVEHINSGRGEVLEVGVGTGLGLSVSYGIVENMGGKLSVRNSTEGARFCIELPVVPADQITKDGRPA